MVAGDASRASEDEATGRTSSRRCAPDDILVHQPYESFAASVERFVAEAVDDPDVLAIKLTVYRTSDDSTLIPSLIKAAERGKQAVCMVELKARFDERSNITWARALEEAGAHVVLGLPGLKAHAKALIVVRREGSGVRHYAHLGTGNYNAKTARLYEDFGLFTTDPDITADIADLFNSLTGFGRPPGYRKLLVAPAHMRDASDARDPRDGRRPRAWRERADHDEDERARRRALDQGALSGLAGRRADRPQHPWHLLPPARRTRRQRDDPRRLCGRTVPRALAHLLVPPRRQHRYYIGSADLMPRNLDNRVELLAPVEARDLQDELEDTLERCFADDTFAWELRRDGTWSRRQGGDRSVHVELRQRALEAAEAAEAGI